MKRLSVYASIAILTISFFGNIIAPQKVSAQATTDAFVSAKAEIMNAFSSASATFQSNYNQKQQTEYALNYARLDSILSARAQSLGSGYSDAAFQINALNDFRAYLTSRRTLQIDPEIITVLSNTINLTNALHTSVSNSTLTQDFLNAQSGGAGPVVNLGQTVNASNAQLQNTQSTGETDTGVCISLTSFSLTTCLRQVIVWFIKVTFVEIAGFLLALAAGMFNYSVQVGILNFSQWAPDTLYPIWLIIRQILSLLIVFVGLYLGFMYILGKDEKFAKYVPWVVMFALFVNFSYPLARTAIDVSNVVSLNIYASAVGNNAIAGTGGAGAGTIIVNRLGLQGLMGRAATEGGSSALLDVNSISGALLVVAFALYAAYIFFMVTGIIVLRTVSLVFLTVASPFLLIDSVLPFLGEKAMQIRKIFFEQLIVGPIFMIMLSLTMSFLDVFNGPLQAAGSSTATFFNLIMMLIMLHIMITVTKKTAGAIGEYGTKMMGTVGGATLGVAAGGAGLLARKGIGGLAMKARESAWVQNNKDSMLGRSAYSMSNSLANSSFDLRNSKVVAGKMSKLGMGMGMGRTMGYEEHARKRSEEVQKVGETAGARHKEDVLDAEGNVIHRKGDFTEEGRLAYSRYNETLGGRSIFMSKEQKAKTKELLKENVTKNMTKEEAEIKKRADELSKDYNVVGTRSEDLNKTKEQLKKEKAAAFDTMNANLDKLRKSDPTLRGSEAQSLSAAINIIKDKKEEEAIVLNKKISDTVARYKKINVSDTDAVSRQNKIIDSLDAEEQELFKEHLADPTKPYSSKPVGALTGDALRQQRLQKVSDGRAVNADFANKILSDSNDNLRGHTEYRKSFNEKYDKEIADLENNTPDSLILDANGRPMKTAPSQAQINEVESRRTKDTEYMDRVEERTKEFNEMVQEEAATASAKQQASAARAVKFSGGSSSSLDLDLSAPAQVADVHNESFQAKIAAKRQAALARGAAAADAEMTENGSPSPSTGTPTPNPTIPPTPPRAPSGATAANETPYDQGGGAAAKEPLAA